MAKHRVICGSEITLNDSLSRWTLFKPIGRSTLMNTHPGNKCLLLWEMSIVYALGPDYGEALCLH